MMSKPMVTVARKNFLRGHERENLRKNTLKRQPICIWVKKDTAKKQTTKKTNLFCITVLLSKM